jgi:hypothetical protein
MGGSHGHAAAVSRHGSGRLAMPSFLGGDDRRSTRTLLSQCKQHVFNLSEMTESQAEALVRQTEGRVCVRYFVRTDGTVMTNDCLDQARRQMRRRLATALLSLLTLAGGLLAWALMFLNVSTGSQGHMSLGNRIVAWLYPMPTLREPAPTRERFVMGKMLPPPEWRNPNPSPPSSPSN